MRLFRKLVPACWEALFGDDSRFFRDKKKSIRRQLGFLLDSEEKNDPQLEGAMGWLYAVDARVCRGPNTTVEGHPLLRRGGPSPVQPAERKPPL